MTIDRTTGRRTDEQPEAILDESAEWIVTGRQGRVLSSVVSLRHALETARQYGHSGSFVSAICRLPGKDIIIFKEQINRLRGAIDVREMTIK